MRIILQTALMSDGTDQSPRSKLPELGGFDADPDFKFPLGPFPLKPEAEGSHLLTEAVPDINLPLLPLCPGHPLFTLSHFR